MRRPYSYGMSTVGTVLYRREYESANIRTTFMYGTTHGACTRTRDCTRTQWPHQPPRRAAPPPAGPGGSGVGRLFTHSAPDVSRHIGYIGVSCLSRRALTAHIYIRNSRRPSSSHRSLRNQTCRWQSLRARWRNFALLTLQSSPRRSCNPPATRSWLPRECSQGQF